MVDSTMDDSWPRRLAAYLRTNRTQLTLDVAILLAWIVLTAALFRWLGLPQWLHYLVLFVGVAVYVRLTPRWETPARPRE